MTEVNQHNLLRMGIQIYYAGQWAEAGVYRCLDPCSADERVVTLEADGVLPDPTHGWIARFYRSSNFVKAPHTAKGGTKRTGNPHPNRSPRGKSKTTGT